MGAMCDVCPILVASCSSELYPAGLLILISFCIIFSQKAMSAFWRDRQA